MRESWKGGLVLKYKQQTSIPSSTSHKEATSDDANEALNNIMNLSVFG
jgi:hypothetical protein